MEQRIVLFAGMTSGNQVSLGTASTRDSKELFHRRSDRVGGVAHEGRHDIDGGGAPRAPGFQERSHHAPSPPFPLGVVLGRNWDKRDRRKRVGCLGERPGFRPLPRIFDGAC